MHLLVLSFDQISQLFLLNNKLALGPNLGFEMNFECCRFIYGYYMNNFSEHVTCKMYVV